MNEAVNEAVNEAYTQDRCLERAREVSRSPASRRIAPLYGTLIVIPRSQSVVKAADRFWYDKKGLLAAKNHESRIELPSHE